MSSLILRYTQMPLEKAEFSAKIKEFFDKNSLSIKDVSEKTDTTRSTIYDYVNGVALPGAPFLKKLHSLGCDLNWLFSDDDQPLKIAEPLIQYKSEADKLRAENKELREKLKKMEAIFRA